MDRRGLLNDPVETQLLILDGRQSGIWTALPCIVTKVNLSAMTLEAQPAIQGVTYDQNNNPTYVNLPILGDVPIVFPSAGGFTLTLPIAVGNEVLVVFASRCIDAWWQQGGVQLPIEMRMHDLSDGFAIPGPKSQPKVIGGISSTGAQLRNDAGTTYIELSADGSIKLVSPTGLTMTGNLSVTGTILATGEITGGPDAIPLSTHTHGGVTVGGGTTGVPIP
jgi:hypothetical protein